MKRLNHRLFVGLAVNVNEDRSLAPMVDNPAYPGNLWAKFETTDLTFLAVSY